MKDMGSRQYTSRLLWTVFVLALVIRLVFGVLLPRHELLKPVRDQHIYLILAENIAAGKGLIGPSIEPVDISKLPPVTTRRSIVEAAIQPGYFRGVVPMGKPTAFWLPLYPLFLSLFQTDQGVNLLLIRIIQALVGALMVFPVFALGLRVFRNSVTALIAASLISVYPFYIYYTGIIMTETIYTFLLVVFLLVLLHCLDKQTVTSALLLGIFGSLTFLTRSVMIGLIPLCIVLLLLQARPLRRGLLLAFTLVIAFMTTISGWTVRNYTQFNRVIVLPTKGGPTLWARNHPLFLAEEIEATSFSGINPDDFNGNALLRFPAFTDETEAERSEQLFSTIFSFLSSNPLTYLKLCLLRVRWLLSPVAGQVSSFWQTLLSLLSYGLTFLLAIYGLVTLKEKHRNREMMVLLLFLVYFVVFHALINGDTRFRIPLDFIFILLAAPVYGEIVTWFAKILIEGKKSPL